MGSDLPHASGTAGCRLAAVVAGGIPSLCAVRWRRVAIRGRGEGDGWHVGVLVRRGSAGELARPLALDALARRAGGRRVRTTVRQHETRAGSGRSAFWCTHHHAQPAADATKAKAKAKARWKAKGSAGYPPRPSSGTLGAGARVLSLSGERAEQESRVRLGDGEESGSALPNWGARWKRQAGAPIAFPIRNLTTPQTPTRHHGTRAHTARAEPPAPRQAWVLGTLPQTAVELTYGGGWKRGGRGERGVAGKFIPCAR